MNSLGLYALPEDNDSFESTLYDHFIQTEAGRLTSVLTWNEVVYSDRNLIGLTVFEAIEVIGQHGWTITPPEPDLEWFEMEHIEQGIGLSVKQDRVWSASINLDSNHPLWDG